MLLLIALLIAESAFPSSNCWIGIIGSLELSRLPVPNGYYWDTLLYELNHCPFSIPPSHFQDFSEIGALSLQGRVSGSQCLSWIRFFNDYHFKTQWIGSPRTQLKHLPIPRSISYKLRARHWCTGVNWMLTKKGKICTHIQELLKEILFG